MSGIERRQRIVNQMPKMGLKMKMKTRKNL
jgi:hypothetical protein